MPPTSAEMAFRSGFVLEGGVVSHVHINYPFILGVGVGEEEKKMPLNIPTDHRVSESTPQAMEQSCRTQRNLQRARMKECKALS